MRLVAEVRFEQMIFGSCRWPRAGVDADQPSHPPVVSPEGRVFGRPGNRQALNGCVFARGYKIGQEREGNHGPASAT